MGAMTMPDGSTITAVLGPTNTGKTHRAVERMLEHDSGMIGLPLRLLAREVYDRITASVGEQRVGLVTGEEKRVPRCPSYWVCTVEAMPTDREVDFLAVDEVQLAAHDQRGHVFTDRLLHARGRRETWFMGAETMRPILAELVPTARHAVCPRLSRLSARGVDKLARLPPRTAIVAFSLPEVYGIAERVRALRGGAAVVLGALSPRTRNAQVAMFQSGEVDYVVATDAIGMGLNLNVAHVAFASLRKFDGRSPRELEPAELAQIAGRAGRYLSDGTFGTVAPIALPPEVTTAIETHSFPAVRRVLYRNTDLDLDSLDGLFASLRRRPPRGCLRLVDDRDDTRALRILAEDPAIRPRVCGREAVSLLWEVCQVPDFCKVWLESHMALLGEVFTMLTGPKGVIDARWLERKIEDIDDAQGDIDTLVGRLASIRTYTFLTQRGRYVKRAGYWQDRAREVEDRLSDALHERLVERFVERGLAGQRTSPRPARGGTTRLDEVSEVDRGHPFAALAALRAKVRPVAVEAAQAMGSSGWVERVVTAAHESFRVGPRGVILHHDQPIATLSRGTTLLLPDVRLADIPEVGQGARSRILRRLVAFARDWVGELLALLRGGDLGAMSADVRGIAYQLEQGLGTALTRDVEDRVAALDASQRGRLGELGIEVGQRVVFVPALLRRDALEQRVALCAAFFEQASSAAPRPGAVSIPAPPGAASRMYTAIGFPIFGSRAVRSDVAESVYRLLAGKEVDANDRRLSGLLGCPLRDVRRVVEALAP
jgi:ATP-dependent RNA helicase SUPV3L1/SUV3